MKTKSQCNDCLEEFNIQHKDDYELEAFSFCPDCNSSNIKKV